MITIPIWSLILLIVTAGIIPLFVTVSLIYSGIVAIAEEINLRKEHRKNARK